MNFWERSSIGRYAAIFALAMIAVAAGALAMALPGGANSPTSVLAADTTLGVDVTTDGNSASTLGTIDSCKQVNVGESFDVDLYITEVSGMRQWEYFLSFDPAKVHVIAQSFQMVQGSDGSDLVPNSVSPHFLAIGGTPQVSGSGVLARVTFEADAAGISNIAIAHNPKWPFLHTGNEAIGDTTGDGFFDGPLVPGRVAIGEGCPAGPIITPSPGPTVTVAPTATPEPTAAPALLGDSNCDGQITTPDVITTLTGAIGVGDGGACLYRGDANCSGGPDANDALRILRFVSGQPASPPTNCQAVGDAIP